MTCSIPAEAPIRGLLALVLVVLAGQFIRNVGRRRREEGAALSRYRAKLAQWEQEGYDVSAFRKKWFGDTYAATGRKGVPWLTVILMVVAFAALSWATYAFLSRGTPASAPTPTSTPAPTLTPAPMPMPSPTPIPINVYPTYGGLIPLYTPTPTPINVPAGVNYQLVPGGLIPLYTPTPTPPYLWYADIYVQPWTMTVCTPTPTPIPMEVHPWIAPAPLYTQAPAPAPTPMPMPTATGIATPGRTPAAVPVSRFKPGEFAVGSPERVSVFAPERTDGGGVTSPPPYGTIWVIVKVAIENTGPDQFMMDDFVLADAQGRLYRSAERSGASEFISGAITAGKTFGGTAKYLVPDTAYNLDVHHYVQGLGPAIWQLPW